VLRKQWYDAGITTINILPIVGKGVFIVFASLFFAVVLSVSSLVVLGGSGRKIRPIFFGHK
jgi:hypothetical protein